MEKYLKYSDGDYYLELPGKESILVYSRTKTTKYIVEHMGKTYIDLEACGINYKVEDNILWIE